MNTDEIFQFEKNLEAAFAGILSTATPHVFLSRTTDVAKSPRLDIRATVGQTQNHAKAMIDRVRWVYDTYDGAIEVKITTNRTSEEKSDAHYKLVGQVRARMQLYWITQEWAKQNSPLLVMDVREASSDASFVDENDLDTSTLTFAIYFSINPKVWPPNL